MGITLKLVGHSFANVIGSSVVPTKGDYDKTPHITELIACVRFPPSGRKEAALL